MEVPSEMQFEQAISELKMSSELNHSHGNKQDGCCDMCSFCKEIDRRGREAGQPTQIDQIALSALQHDMSLGLMLSINPGAMEAMLHAVRIACLVGYKIQKSEHGIDELERLAEL